MQSETIESKNRKTGIGYFFYGMELCFMPGIRRFIIFPLLANLLLFIGLIVYLYYHLGAWIDRWLSFMPGWMDWLYYIIYPVLFGVVIILFSYFFSSIANWIAAPFNGLLAEQLEKKLTGKQVSNQSIFDLLKDTPRMLHREWVKLIYYLPRALGLLLLMLVPVIGQTVGPLLWFVFSSWMMAIQYCDYPFDNHRISFYKMKQDLARDKSLSYGFGLMVSVFMLIPVINLIVMPVAICGATAMWVECYAKENKIT